MLGAVCYVLLGVVGLVVLLVWYCFVYALHCFEVFWL